jgi:hypothetical protein
MGLRANVVACSASCRKPGEEVVEPLEPVAHPQQDAQLAQAGRVQTIGAAQLERLLAGQLEELQHPPAVPRVAGIEALVSLAHPLEGGRIYLVDRGLERGDASGEECLAQALRRR